MARITVGCEDEQLTNSEQCSELDTTSTAMMLFNNGYAFMIMGAI